MRKQRALIVSPFATAPLDAGQRLRAHQSTKAFEKLGYEITFLLYAFENHWYWKNQPALLKKMLAQWGDVRVVFSQRQVSLPPKSGALHRVDEWWDPQLDVMLPQMFKYEDFDICVVHNVWLSKAFDLVPRRIVRVLDTHDVFSARSAAFASVGAKPEFLLVDKEDETFGLERADLVLTIKPQEAALLKSYGVRRPVLNLPYCPEPGQRRPSSRDYLHPGKVVYGFLGTAHVFNKVGLQALLKELDRLVRRTFAPVELIVAGAVSRALDFEGLAFRPICLDVVDDEVAFYESVDVAVVPAFAGTGFKVKVAELIDLNMPLLCAEHAAEGVTLAPGRLFADAGAMAEAMVRIATFRPPLAEMRAQSGAAIEQLRKDFDAGRAAIGKFLREARAINLFLFEERPLTGELTTQFVAGVLQARALASQERSLLVVPGEWRLDLDELNAVTVVGTELVASNEREAISRRLDGACLTVWATPRRLAAAQREDAELSGARTTAVVDCRFMNFDLLDDRDLAEIGARRGAIINHRQCEAPQSLPFRFDQELFCAPLLGWEATWDPVVTATLRHYLRMARPAKAAAVFVCAGKNAKQAMRLILEMRELGDAAVFDVDDPQDLEAAAATVLWAVHESRQNFTYVSATRRASWLWALVDHGAKMHGRIRTMRFSEWTEAASAVEAKTAAVASMEIFWKVRSRLAALAA